MTRQLAQTTAKRIAARIPGDDPLQEFRELLADDDSIEPVVAALERKQPDQPLMSMHRICRIQGQVQARVPANVERAFIQLCDQYNLRALLDAQASFLVGFAAGIAHARRARS
jgi:hypothetical protein